MIFWELQDFENGKGETDPPVIGQNPLERAYYSLLYDKQKINAIPVSSGALEILIKFFKSHKYILYLTT